MQSPPRQSPPWLRLSLKQVENTSAGNGSLYDPRKDCTISCQDPAQTRGCLSTVLGVVLTFFIKEDSETVLRARPYPEPVQAVLGTNPNRKQEIKLPSSRECFPSLFFGDYTRGNSSRWASFECGTVRKTVVGHRLIGLAMWMQRLEADPRDPEDVDEEEILQATEVEKRSNSEFTNDRRAPIMKHSPTYMRSFCIALHQIIRA